jgi:hypothetical protein
MDYFMDDRILRLTEGLQQLQIARNQVQQEENQVLAESQQALQESRGWGGVQPQQQRARQQHPPAHAFVPGQHIWITNRVRRNPLGRATQPQDHAAIVEAVLPNRINIMTYSGVHTWRLPSNLRDLPPQKRPQRQLHNMGRDKVHPDTNMSASNGDSGDGGNPSKDGGGQFQKKWKKQERRKEPAILGVGITFVSSRSQCTKDFRRKG